MKMLIASISFIAIFMLPSVGYTQETTESSFVFVEVKDLDPYTYGDLVKAVRQRTDFSIKSACVPANIIMFELKEGNRASLDDNYETIKGIVLQVTSLYETNLMVGYSEEVFLKKCKEFRRGGRQ